MSFATTPTAQIGVTHTYATETPRPRQRTRDGPRQHAAALAPGIVVFVLVGMLAANDGGTSLSSGMGSGSHELVGGGRDSPANTAATDPARGRCLTAIAAVAAWTAISMTWSSDATRSSLEAERAFVYVGVVWSLVALGRRTSAMSIVVGGWLVVLAISTWAVGTSLLPDRFGLYTDVAERGRLFAPLGYWNATGILAAIGVMLGVGLAARSPSKLVRVTAAAGTPVQLLAVYLTFNRAAWPAMVAAAVVVLIVVPHRVRYALAVVATVVPAGATLAVAASSPPSSRLLIALVLTTLTSALAIMCLDEFASWSYVGRRVQRRNLVALAVILGAILITTGAVAGAKGSHWLSHQLTGRQYTGPTNPAARLSSLSLNGRPQLWQQAVDQFASHPINGGGAGSFAPYWLQHRPSRLDVLDAHSLYLQTLAELGILGLVLLATLLALPIVAAIGGRDHPMVAAALAGYVAYLAHAAVDWDWQVPAVTVAALACGVALLATATPSRRALGRTPMVGASSGPARSGHGRVVRGTGLKPRRIQS